MDQHIPADGLSPADHFRNSRSNERIHEVLVLRIAGYDLGRVVRFRQFNGSADIAHGARDTRSFWRKRILAIISTLASAIFFLLSFTLTALGHDAAISLSYFYRSARLAHSSLFWETVRWIANLLLIMIAINLINYFLPDVKRTWRWFTPGTSFVALTFIASSVCFNFYVRHSSNISRIYGALAGVIIFMLWIYMSSLILLIGAETDTAIRELAQEGVIA